MSGGSGQSAEIDASRPMGTFTDRQVWQTISRHAFIVSVGAYGRESCACGWYRDGWDSPGFEAHFAAHITPLVMAAEQRAKEAEQRARHHYAAFCGAAAELARLKTAADKVGHQAACLVEPCDCWMLDLLPLLDGGTCDWCGLVGDHAEGCRLGLGSDESAGRGCDHYWLDRPESDTHECLACGTEGSGPAPVTSPGQADPS